MRLFRIVRRRLTSLFRRQRAEAELDRELSLHVDLLIKENVAHGMSESEARAAALREFGPVTQTEEACRDTRRVHWIDDFRRDLVYAVRQLGKSPGFAFTAILSLALGIGANTAIFSLADAVLLRMLPVREPQQLIEITGNNGHAICYPLGRYIRERNDVFSGVFVMSAGRYSAGVRVGPREAGEMKYSPVSGDYFSVLGVTPVLGRTLTEEDMNSETAAVISYDAWKKFFHGDLGVVGTEIVVGEKPSTIVGVMSPGFSGVVAGQPMDLWVPITWRGRGYLENPEAFIFRVMARRKPGISVEAAEANINVLSRQWVGDRKFPEPIPLEATSASSGLNMLRRRFARPLWVLMGVVMLLLLCVAVNVANLLLVRASKRRREMLIRLSLGAGRSRLIRQLLTESFVLAGIGGGLGLLFAPAVAGSLVRFLSSALGVMKLSFPIDARMLVFTVGISCGAALLFGLAPALRAIRLACREGITSRGGTPQANRFGALLMVGQVAISCMLLSVALLFARSLSNLAQTDIGFEKENVFILSVGTGEGGPKGKDAMRLFGLALDRVAMLPQVRSVALSSEILFGGSTWTEAIEAPAFHPRPGQNRGAVMLVVSPNFFRTMGTRLLSGRDFDARDNQDGQKTAIVNESMARYFLGKRDAVGESFHVTPWDHLSTIVGVVQDARYQSLREPAPPIVYLPYLQFPFDDTNLTIRTVGDPARMANLLWNEVHQVSPLLRFRGKTTQTQQIDGTIAQDRMLAQLSGAFGLAGAILVSLGLFGLTAYEVARRTAEIGVRIALGAQQSSVVRLVVGRAVLLIGCGAVLGTTAAIALMRMAEGLMYGVHAIEPVNLLLPAMILIAIGAAAAYLPARRAASIDPVTALREQ